MADAIVPSAALVALTKQLDGEDEVIFTVLPDWLLKVQPPLAVNVIAPLPDPPPSVTSTLVSAGADVGEALNVRVG